MDLMEHSPLALDTKVSLASKPPKKLITFANYANAPKVNRKKFEFEILFP